MKDSMTDQQTQPETSQTKDIPLENGPLPRGKIIFYCKNCRTIVDAIRIGKKYQYKCPTCKQTEVSFGTEMSIKSVYKIV